MPMRPDRRRGVRAGALGFVAAYAAALVACAPDTTPAPDPWPADAGDVAIDASADATTDPVDDASDAASADTDTSCPDGRTPCEGACVDLDTHPVHCGACDAPCDPGPGEAAACVGGTCERWCAPGFVDRTDDPGCESTCAPTVPDAEVCDGLDNDCDGAVDAADADYTAGRCPLTAGACADTVAPCVDGDATCDAAWYTAADAAATPTGERRCDGLDNDCDGAVDEPCCADALVLAPAPAPPGDAIVWASTPIAVVTAGGPPRLVALVERQRRDGAFERRAVEAPLRATGDPDGDTERVLVEDDVRDVAVTDDGVAWVLTPGGVDAVVIGGGEAVRVADSGAPAAGVERLRATRVDDEVWYVTGPASAGRGAAVILHRVRDRGVVQTVEAGPPGARPVAIATTGDRVAVVTRAVSDVGIDALVVRWFDRGMTEQATTRALTLDDDGVVQVGAGAGRLHLAVVDSEGARAVTVDGATAAVVSVGDDAALAIGETSDGTVLWVAGAMGDVRARAAGAGGDDALGRIEGADAAPVAVVTAGGRTWLLARVGAPDATARAIALSDEGAPLCDPSDTGPLAE